MGTAHEHLSATCRKQRQSRETVMLEFLGFITVSANRSVFVPREQCSADWAFREFSPFLLTATDIFAPSSSLFPSLYLPLSHRGAGSLESIRTIRIISRISGRTDEQTSYLCICGNTRRRAGPATSSSHRCSGTVASNTRRIRSRKKSGKIYLFSLAYIWQTEYNRLSKKSHIFSLLFDILLLDKISTSKTLCKRREKSFNIACNVI